MGSLNPLGSNPPRGNNIESYKNILEAAVKKSSECAPVSLRVANSKVLMSAQISAKNIHGSVLAKDWRREFSDYEPSDRKKYNKVYNQIYKSKNLKNKNDAAKIANMVCALSEKYGIDPEITVSILENECQFKFTPAVMQHGKSIYKGVMQVDKDTIKSMYYSQSQASSPRLNKHEKALAYDHWRFNSDQARIDELKKLYPTPQDLYTAIQYDVSLGIEVGIMAYKAKLTAAKGSTDRALAEYCGNHYKLPSDSTAQRHYNVIPKYKA